MTKRGVQGCPRFCNSCSKDCTCETCNQCHSCNGRNLTSYGAHVWLHNCTGPNPASTTKDEKYKSVGKFLADTSNRFAQFFESDPYTVKLGGEKAYYIHAEALRQTSPVLKKTIEAQMKETKTKTIELKDFADNELAFGLFIQYCYFGNYGYDDIHKENGIQVHALVYIFAEKIEAIELKSLALKKATLLCAKAVNDTSSASLVKVLQFVLPEAVQIIYGGTYDSNTGKYPSHLKETSGKDTFTVPAIHRDGFRMLLAKFAARYINDLRRNETFMTILEEQPAFGVDILLFTAIGSNFSTDGRGNLEF